MKQAATISSAAMVAGGILSLAIGAFLVLTGHLPPALFEELLTRRLQDGGTILGVVIMGGVMALGLSMLSLSLVSRKWWSRTTTKEQYRRSDDSFEVTLMDTFSVSFPLAGILLAVGLCFANDFSLASKMQLLHMIGAAACYWLFFTIVSDFIDAVGLGKRHEH
ncbi:MAG: hypothetical protein AAF390_04225 [Pseudomonadota bacterium]